MTRLRQSGYVLERLRFLQVVLNEKVVVFFRVGMSFA